MAAKSLNFFKECPICFENVIETKVLACNHEFCVKCVETISKQTAESLGKLVTTCPNCRQDSMTENLHDLPSRFYGDLPCDFCRDDKFVQDLWFCSTCFKIVCSRCEITDHKMKNHPQLTSWLSGDAVQLCCCVLENRAKQKQQNQVEENKKLEESLNSYFQTVTKILVAGNAKVREENCSETLLAKHIRNFYHISGTSSMVGDFSNREESVEHSIRLADLALSLPAANREMPVPEKSRGKILSETELRASLPPEALANYILSKVKPPISDPPRKKSLFEIQLRGKLGPAPGFAWGWQNLAVIFDSKIFEAWQLPMFAGSTKNMPIFRAAVTVTEGSSILMVSVCAQSDVVFVLVRTPKAGNLILIYGNCCADLFSQFIVPAAQNLAPIQTGKSLYLLQDENNLRRLDLDVRFDLRSSARIANWNNQSISGSPISATRYPSSDLLAIFDKSSASVQIMQISGNHVIGARVLLQCTGPVTQLQFTEQRHLLVVAETEDRKNIFLVTPGKGLANAESARKATVQKSVEGLDTVIMIGQDVLIARKPEPNVLSVSKA